MLWKALKTDLFTKGQPVDAPDGGQTVSIFAGNLRVAMIKGTQTYYFHKDHLGSAALMKALDLTHNPTFRENYLDPAMEGGWIESPQPYFQPAALVFPFFDGLQP